MIVERLEFREMKQFIAFVIKETKHILRDKRTMLILFGMPVVMMLLFGFARRTIGTIGIFCHHADCEHPTGSRTTHPQSEGRYGAGVCTESWHADHG